MPSSASAFDLDKIGGRKNGAEETNVENIRAVVAGGHHANGDADTSLACFVGVKNIGGTEKIVVGKVDGELLCIGNLRGHLHGKV